MTAMQVFVHIHVYRTYLMADRIAMIDDLAKTAAYLGRLALGLIDHGSVGGQLAFRSTCR
ncbi:hypothetical protein [Bifidobacterium aesculapii]|uniref:hypothetical protein n=1 Tax=Bifidobacterium aesculapii TaxID=1329411 RepID=UPI0006E3ED04|nr:hypothetical protein [Bifidobacterium aesculapii]